MTASPQTIALALTGASGMPYGLRTLECLVEAGARVYVLYSQAAHVVAKQELDLVIPPRPIDAERMFSEKYRAAPGQVRVFGRDVSRERLRAARLMGSLVETPSLYDRLTGRENLAVTRTLLGCPKAEIDRVLEVVDLTRAADRLVGGYSLGMRQRLGVARALLGRPKLLVLDEPGNGLDPAGLLDMRRLLRDLPEREGVTVFVSSHVLAEVEQVATHVGLMHKGRLLAQTDLKALKASGARTLQVGVDDLAAACAVLAQSGLEATPAEGRLSIPLPPSAGDDRVAAIAQSLVGRGLKLSHLALNPPSLEALYLDLVRAA